MSTETVEFILWHRVGRGRWKPVANADSYTGALDQMDVSDKGRHGDWLVCEKGRDPNETRKAKARA